MFLFPPKLPVSDPIRAWIDESFDRLASIFGGKAALKETKVILPTEAFFPEVWEELPEDLPALFLRVCGYMGVDPNRVEVRLFARERKEKLREMVPHLHVEDKGAAGFYREGGAGETERTIIAIEEKQLANLMSLIGTIAHELAHVLLLGDGHVSRDEPDMEPLTDLATVYRGLGIFTANSALHFSQHHRGWSVKHHGYLSEPAFGYALARFAYQRGETRPVWVRYLNVNLRDDFKRSEAVLRRETRTK